MEKINEILGLIKNKKIVLFGEIHGTREIPEVLSEFFSDFAKREDFDIFLEIPNEFQERIKDFFEVKDVKKSDGRNSFEYYKLVQNIKILNKKYNRGIRIFCIDINSDFKFRDEKNVQNEREEEMAKNILNIIKNKRLFGIIGRLHTSKKIIKLKERIIIPTANIIYKNLGNNLFSIKFSPVEGEFYNFGVKNISDLKEFPDENFDYQIKIKRVNSCSFLDE